MLKDGGMWGCQLKERILAGSRIRLSYWSAWSESSLWKLQEGLHQISWRVESFLRGKISILKVLRLLIRPWRDIFSILQSWWPEMKFFERRSRQNSFPWITVPHKKANSQSPSHHAYFKFDKRLKTSCFLATKPKLIQR